MRCLACSVGLAHRMHFLPRVQPSLAGAQRQGAHKLNLMGERTPAWSRGADLYCDFICEEEIRLQSTLWFTLQRGLTKGALAAGRSSLKVADQGGLRLLQH